MNGVQVPGAFTDELVNLIVRKVEILLCTFYFSPSERVCSWVLSDYWQLFCKQGECELGDRWLTRKSKKTPLVANQPSSHHV